MEQINREDAILYIDTVCWKCKREVAFTNTVEYEGRRYCFQCDEILNPGKGEKWLVL